jgi:hypothetical protein
MDGTVIRAARVADASQIAVVLAKADNARNGVLAADNGGMLLGFVGYSPSRLAETGFVQVTL